MIWARSICEISEADFYVEAIRLVTERAFLKVQDGCDYKCTYCTIPLAREFHEG
jgi:threonylcarbamoyladenosine tRNA methylthiotransferase MtaB